MQYWRPLNRKEGCTCIAEANREVGMARLVGGTGPVQDATAEVQSLADQVKSAVILPSPTNDNERFVDCPCVP